MCFEFVEARWLEMLFFMISNSWKTFEKPSKDHFGGPGERLGQPLADPGPTRETVLGTRFLTPGGPRERPETAPGSPRIPAPDGGGAASGETQAKLLRSCAVRRFWNPRPTCSAHQDPFPP